MSNAQNDNESGLEWLNLKKSQGRKPDYVIKAEAEGVSNKFLRKFQENPFVPIGKRLYEITNLHAIP